MRLCDHAAEAVVSGRECCSGAVMLAPTWIARQGYAESRAKHKRERFDSLSRLVWIKILPQSYQSAFPVWCRLVLSMRDLA